MAKGRGTKGVGNARGGGSNGEGALAAAGIRRQKRWWLERRGGSRGETATVADDMEEARGVALRVDVEPQDTTVQATGSALEPHGRSCQSRWVESGHGHSVWKVPPT